MKPKMLLLTGVFAAIATSFLAQTASADLLSEIKAKKEIVIGTEASFPPFEFVKDGKIVGYDEDVMHYIMAGLPGVKVDQMNVPWQSILPGLAAKKFDIVVTAVIQTQERAEKFHFTQPVADATVGLLVRAGDASIKTPEDISGKVVGSEAGSGMMEALENYNDKLKKEGKPGAKELKGYVSIQDAFADLAAGRINAVAQSISSLGPLVKARPDTFKMLPDVIGPKSYFGYVGRKGSDSDSLVNFFNDRITKLKKSGKLKELQMKWFGFPMEVPDVVTVSVAAK
jgi:polar amino acid transport system substrate-binding protein